MVGTFPPASVLALESILTIFHLTWLCVYTRGVNIATSFRPLNLGDAVVV